MPQPKLDFVLACNNYQNVTVLFCFWTCLGLFFGKWQYTSYQIQIFYFLDLNTKQTQKAKDQFQLINVWNTIWISKEIQADKQSLWWGKTKYISQKVVFTQYGLSRYSICFSLDLTIRIKKTKQNKTKQKTKKQTNNHANPTGN